MDETIRVKIVDDSDKIGVTEPETTSPDNATIPESGEELNLEDYNRPANSSDPGVANLVGQVGRLSFNLMALPLNLLPGQSRYHAKNSLREGFMAFKSLVDEVASSIDESIARSQKPGKVKITTTAENSNNSPANTDISGDAEKIGEGAV
jgi:hypothetical protein